MPWIKRHAWLLAINALYLILGIYWALIIPYDASPDEDNHYANSVQLILNSHRLPIWARDDVQGFKDVFSTYNQMPVLHYVVASVGAAVARNVFQAEPYLGARMVGVLWGLIFINFLFGGVRTACAIAALNGRRPPADGSPPGPDINPSLLASLVTAGAALIPQVLFISTYVNADIHSLAISAIVAFAALKLWERPSGPRIAGFGLAMGLLLVAKYNYFIYVPFIGCFFLWRLARPHGAWTRAFTGRVILCSALIACAVSGFWFVRNVIIYGSPLPLLIDEEALIARGLIRNTASFLRRGDLIWSIREGLFGDTFNSFFAQFGYMNVTLSNGAYETLRGLIILLTVAFVCESTTAKDLPMRRALGILLVLVVACVAAQVRTSLTFMFQPQGRYLFAIIVPIALFTGWAATRKPALIKYPVVFLGLMLWLQMESHALILQTYDSGVPYEPPVFSVYWAGPDGNFQEPHHVTRTHVGDGAAFKDLRFPMPGVTASFIRLDFPDYPATIFRNLSFRWAGPGGTQSVDWNVTPLLYCHHLIRHGTDIFEPVGPNPFIIFSPGTNAVALREAWLGGRVEKIPQPKPEKKGFKP